MASLLNKEPAAYEAEKSHFLQELKSFHDGKGTSYRHLPVIDGKDVDLYQLYWLVTASGGWEKVNSRSGWDELVPIFGLGESTANGALALKQTYLRYLDAYEKLHYAGEDDLDGDDNTYYDEEDTRSRRHRTGRMISSVPCTYNHQQHMVRIEEREACGMSTQVYQKSDYDRLTLSLTSPLPNEQDFAINVCTLLSNEGRHTLKLSKCPRLLDLLLAHAGVFNHKSMDTYLSDLYASERKYDLSSFWANACRDKSLRALMLNMNRKLRNWRSNSEEEEESSEGRIRELEARVMFEMEHEEDEDGLFASGSGLGTREMAGQRVLQVATIVRNLSFEEDNAVILAGNLTCLRFCLLCCSSDWSNMNQIGFDILSNISSEIVMEAMNESCTTDVLISTLISCVSSPDRFRVIASLDILCKLCSVDLNEPFIEAILNEQQSIYDQLVTYLSLHDIHLLISTLECLYSLSSLGEMACSAICRTHGALDALVSLVTVEAQSYGPKACILMRVVETVPGATNALHHQVPQPQQPRQLQALTTVQPTVVQQQEITSQQQQLIQQQQQKLAVSTNQTVKVESQQPLVQQQRAILPQRVQTTEQQQQVQMQQQARPQYVTTMVPTTITQAQVRPQTASAQQGQTIRMPVVQGQQIKGQVQQIQPRPVTSAAQPVQQQQQPVAAPNAVTQPQQQPPPNPGQQVQLRVSNDEANRAFCISWLKATYESASGSRIQHEIMYKQYLASLHKLGKRDVISAQLYAVCVRSLFGGSVGPNKRTLPSGQTDHFFEGVKVRPQPLTLRVPQNPTQAPTQANNGQPVQQVTSTVPQPAVVTQQAKVQPVAQPVMGNQQQVIVGQQIQTAAAQPKLVPQPPGSPILNNLLQKTKPVEQVTSTVPTVPTVPQPVQQAPQIQKTENGNTILDGLLQGNPKNGTPCTTVTTVNHVKTEQPPITNGMLANLLEKKPLVPEVNGHAKMNGDTILANTLKRPASEVADGIPGAKMALIETNGVVSAAANGNGLTTAARVVPSGIVQQQVITQVGGQKVIVPAIAQTAAAAAPGNGAVMVTGQPGQQPSKTIIILQPQNKVISTMAGGALVNGGIVTNGPTSVSLPAGTVMVNGHNGTAATVPQPQPVQLAQQTAPPQIRPQPQQPAQQPIVQQQPQHQAQVVVTQQPQAQQQPVQPPAPPAQVVISRQAQPASSAAATPTVPASSTTSTTPAAAPTTPLATHVPIVPTPVPKPNPQAPFLCEWQACMKAYKTAKEVELHAIKVHCPEGQTDLPCLWMRCDGMRRKRFSLMTHIQDRHCHPQLMKLMAVRRVQIATTGKSEVPLPPAPPAHPGYPPNAALHAIKRHAAEFKAPKVQTLADEKEGPVTKSIRLTSALILKNLVSYSSTGRKRLKAYESHLSTVALSNVESNRTVSQILYEIDSNNE